MIEGGPWEPVVGERWLPPIDFDIHGAEYLNDFLLAGDYDGDGRDEVLVSKMQAGGSKPICSFWAIDFDPAFNQWRLLPEIKPFEEEDETRIYIKKDACVAGDFDGDGIDEIVIARDWDYQDRHDNYMNRFWVMKYDTPNLSWQNLGSEIDGLNAVIEFRSRKEVKFAVSGDFDGDGRDEIAMAQDGTNQFWVIKYDSGSGWIHFEGSDDEFDFQCFGKAPDQEAEFAVVADIDGDGRDEIVVSISDTNLFWVVKFDDILGWHLFEPNDDLDFNASFACSPVHSDYNPNPPYSKYAIAGDYDGDGCDEIAIKPSTPTGHRGVNNDFWVIDFLPDYGNWIHLSNETFGGYSLLDFSCSDRDRFAHSASSGDFDGDGCQEIAAQIYNLNALWVMELAASYDWQHLSPISNHANHADVSFGSERDRSDYFVAGDFDGDGRDELFVAKYFRPQTGDQGPWNLSFWMMNYNSARVNWEHDCISTFIPIDYLGPFEISDQLSDLDFQIRKRALATAYAANELGMVSNLVYLEEAFYFVPLLMALHLQRQGRYRAALDWFCTLFDDPSYSGMHLMCNWLDPADSPPESDADAYTRPGDWLLDPFNPHSVAKFRHGAYRRFTLICLIRCLFEYADSEFTMDNIESIARARRYYIKALDLLDLPEIKQIEECEGVIAELSINVVEPVCQASWEKLKHIVEQITDREILDELIPKIVKVIGLEHPCNERIAEALKLVKEALKKGEDKETQKVGEIASSKKNKIETAYAALLSNDFVAKSVKKSAAMVGSAVESFGYINRHSYFPSVPTDGYIPWPSFDFCVPPNPIINALRRHGENRLNYLRNCRNIAGHPRVVSPYAAATDAVSGLPYLEDGAIVLPGMATYQPTQYRYETLIERAKHLVNLAQQFESALLSAIEKRDAELYGQLRARQDLRLTRAQITLQDLRVTEADHGIRLAELQKERAVIQRDHYSDLIKEGWLPQETASLLMMGTAALLSTSAAYMQIQASGLHAIQAFVSLGASSGLQGYSELAAVA